jgi:hypothetical protein
MMSEDELERVLDSLPLQQLIFDANIPNQFLQKVGNILRELPPSLSTPLVPLELLAANATSQQNPSQAIPSEQEIERVRNLPSMIRKMEIEFPRKNAPYKIRKELIHARNIDTYKVNNRSRFRLLAGAMKLRPTLYAVVAFQGSHVNAKGKNIKERVTTRWYYNSATDKWYTTHEEMVVGEGL